MPFGSKNCSVALVYRAICKVEQLRASHGWEPRLASDPPINPQRTAQGCLSCLSRSTFCIWVWQDKTLSLICDLFPYKWIKHFLTTSMKAKVISKTTQQYEKTSKGSVGYSDILCPLLLKTKIGVFIEGLEGWSFWTNGYCGYSLTSHRKRACLNHKIAMVSILQCYIN